MWLLRVKNDLIAYNEPNLLYDWIPVTTGEGTIMKILSSFTFFCHKNMEHYTCNRTEKQRNSVKQIYDRSKQKLLIPGKLTLNPLGM